MTLGDLTDKLGTLLFDADLRLTFGERSRLEMERWSWHASTEKAASVLRTGAKRFTAVMTRRASIRSALLNRASETSPNGTELQIAIVRVSAAQTNRVYPAAKDSFVGRAGCH